MNVSIHMLVLDDVNLGVRQALKRRLRSSRESRPKKGEVGGWFGRDGSRRRVQSDRQPNRRDEDLEQQGALDHRNRKEFGGGVGMGRWNCGSMISS